MERKKPLNLLKCAPYKHLEVRHIRVKGVSRRRYKRVCDPCGAVEWLGSATFRKKQLTCHKCVSKLVATPVRNAKISATLRQKYKDNPSYLELIQQRNREEGAKRTGSNHWNWQGGITPVDQVDRNSEETKQWRTAVFKRDLYHCRVCGTGTELHAHHVFSWAKYPELRYEVNNGMALCESCHDKIHTYEKEVSKTCQYLYIQENKKAVNYSSLSETAS